jgi:hypothetical protein
VRTENNREPPLQRETNEVQFEGWLQHLGYSMPELLRSPHRLDLPVLRQLRFRMAKMKADGDWDSHWCDPRYAPTPRETLEEVESKVAKGRQSQPVEPKSVVGPVSADRLHWSASKRPRYRRSPPRGDDFPPRYSDPLNTGAISPDTGNGRYTRGASVASQRENSERLHYRSAEAEVVTDYSTNRNAPRRPMASHAARLASGPDREPLLDAVEGCQRLLETQRVDLASLRGSVQTGEAVVAAERRFCQDEGNLARQVQDLREGLAQRDCDLRHFHDRCADLERAHESDRSDQHDHLGCICHVYARVAALEARAPQTDPAAPDAPAASALTQNDLAQVMALALQQISRSSDSQSQPPPQGIRLEHADVKRWMHRYCRWLDHFKSGKITAFPTS